MKYNWIDIQQYYDEGHTVTECQEKFGFARLSWTKSVNAGRVKARPREKPLEELKPQSRGALKKRLIKLGIPYRCALCGISTWNEKPLTLQLDHIDGDHQNRVLENWRLLCPNCHSQTDTFCGKNVRRKRT